MQNHALTLLEVELKETLNSIAHLERSVAELKQAIVEEGPDQDYKDAIGENIVAIAKYRAKASELEKEIAQAKNRPVMKNEPLAVFVPKGHPSHGRDLLAELHSGASGSHSHSQYLQTDDDRSGEPSRSVSASMQHFEISVKDDSPSEEMQVDMGDEGLAADGHLKDLDDDEREAIRRAEQEEAEGAWM